MNDLEQIEAIIAKHLTITDQRLMDGVIGAVMDAVNAEREACMEVCWGVGGTEAIACANLIRARGEA
jgi:hypothetical protein